MMPEPMREMSFGEFTRNAVVRDLPLRVRVPADYVPRGDSPINLYWTSPADAAALDADPDHALRDGYHSLRSEAQLYALSKDAPRWLKMATGTYYALQSYAHSEDAPRWVKKATDGYWTLRQEYGYWALRYKYELVRARREARRSSNASRRKG